MSNLTTNDLLGLIKKQEKEIEALKKQVSEILLKIAEKEKTA